MEGETTRPEVEVRDDLTELGVLRYVMATEAPYRLVCVIMAALQPTGVGIIEKEWKGHAFIYCNGRVDAEYHNTCESMDAAQADVEEWWIDFAGLGATPTIGRRA